MSTQKRGSARLTSDDIAFALLESRFVDGATKNDRFRQREIIRAALKVIKRIEYDPDDLMDRTQGRARVRKILERMLEQVGKHSPSTQQAATQSA